MKHVTQNDRDLVERLSFPEFRWSPDQGEEYDMQPRDSDKSSSQQDRERDEKDAGKLYQQNEIVTVNSALDDTELDATEIRGGLDDDNVVSDSSMSQFPIQLTARRI